MVAFSVDHRKYEGCRISKYSEIRYATYVNEMQPNTMDTIYVSFYIRCTNCKSNSPQMHKYAAGKYGVTSAQVRFSWSSKCDLFLARSRSYEYGNTQRTEMSLWCSMHDIRGMVSVLRVFLYSYGQLCARNGSHFKLCKKCTCALVAPWLLAAYL